MSIRTKLFAPGVLGMVALSALVAACGGGGGGDSGSVSSSIARLECHVTDTSGKAVSGATVTYQNQVKAYTTTTNDNGNCRIDMPAAEVGTVKYPAVTVTKDGYEPQTGICTEIRPGTTCEVQMAPLRLLGANVSIPVGGDTVWHLGDGAFEGSNNSQFQKATDGLQLEFPITDWADQVKKMNAAGQAVTTATVYLDAKGWQSDVCRNTIALSGDAGTQTMDGGVSGAEGYWTGGTNVPFVFSVAQVGLAEGKLVLVSGECRGTTDRDDFEVNRIRVVFN